MNTLFSAVPQVKTNDEVNFAFIQAIIDHYATNISPLLGRSPDEIRREVLLHAGEHLSQMIINPTSKESKPGEHTAF